MSGSKGSYSDRVTQGPGQLVEHAALVALIRSLPKGGHWADVTASLLDRGSALAIWQEQDDATLLPEPGRAQVLERALADVGSWHGKGWTFLSILDTDYPTRLREIHQAPPFLFASGMLVCDEKAVAVVGSRKVSPRGLEIAEAIASRLASAGITVLSGLAEGVDSAAHRAALRAGGRTVAVIGTGIAQSFPAANRELQSEIESNGLVLSQFWPDGPPQRHNFIMRNAVMSGYGVATIVVEAGENSGARAQARMAVEHGRPVILTDHVVSSNEWAKRMVGRPGVHVASSVAEAMDQVDRVLAREQEVDNLLSNLVGCAM